MLKPKSPKFWPPVLYVLLLVGSLCVHIYVSESDMQSGLLNLRCKVFKINL